MPLPPCGRVQWCVASSAPVKPARKLGAKPCGLTGAPLGDAARAGEPGAIRVPPGTTGTVANRGKPMTVPARRHHIGPKGHPP